MSDAMKWSYSAVILQDRACWLWSDRQSVTTRLKPGDRETVCYYKERETVCYYKEKERERERDHMSMLLPHIYSRGMTEYVLRQYVVEIIELPSEEMSSSLVSVKIYVCKRRGERRGN